MTTGRAGAVLSAILLAAALAAPITAAAPVAAATLEQAARDYDAGRFEAARAAWTELAGLDDAEAAFRLGILFDLGRGVPSDPAAALRWYRTAGERGHSAAQLNAALLYDNGRGTARDVAEAATWYGRAAAHGDHRAEYNLGLLYKAGQGVPRNPDMAATWFTAAASGGLRAAAEQVASIGRASPAGAAIDASQAPSPSAVRLAAPGPDAAVPRHGGTESVELVWDAPAQAFPVAFYVEVLALTPEGARPAFSGYSDSSAILVRLDPAWTHCVWRVYAVGPRTRTYTPSGWSRFSVSRTERASP